MSEPTKRLTRREGLLGAAAILSDERMLKESVNKDATLDITLYMLAKNDAVLMERLSKYLDCQELIKDIQHVRNHERLKALKDKLKEEM